MERDEATALVYANLAFYPQSPPPAETIEAYIREFVRGDYPLAATAIAFARHRRASRYWPALSELWDHLAAAALADVPAWDEAWSLVFEAARSGRPERVPTDWPPLVAEVVRAIGWDVLCLASLSELATLRAHFRDVYSGRLQRRRDAVRFAALGDPLAGVRALPAGRP